jgi:hypothetical protein
MITAYPVVSDTPSNANWDKIMKCWDLIATADSDSTITIPLPTGMFLVDGSVPLYPTLTPMSGPGLISRWRVEEIAGAGDSITLVKATETGSGDGQVQLRLTLMVPPQYWPAQVSVPVVP